MILKDDTVLLRDFRREDIAKRIEWETEKTEWQLWDAPWEYEGLTEEQIRREFSEGKQLFDTVKARFFASDPTFSQRSWGMSHDYKIAIECGSNIVRVGTAIFGERVY